MELTLKLKFRKRGNGSYLIIPKALEKALNFQNNQEYDIIIKNFQEKKEAEIDSL